MKFKKLPVGLFRPEKVVAICFFISGVVSAWLKIMNRDQNLLIRIIGILKITSVEMMFLNVVTFVAKYILEVSITPEKH